MPMYISKNWSTTEWDCHHRSENQYAYDNEEGLLCTDNPKTANLFKILDLLRDWNPNWVINWTEKGWKSGYRDEYVNAECGGTERSHHLAGCAADIHEANTDASGEALASAIQDAAKAYGLEDQIELGIYYDWCHIATPGYYNLYYDY